MPTYSITLPSVNQIIDANDETEATEYFWHEYQQFEEDHQNDLIIKKLIRDLI